MRTRHFLREVDLFVTPETFTQGVLARTKDGRPTDIFDPDAVQFCLLGATVYVAHSKGASARIVLRAGERLSRASDKLFHGDCLDVNDSHGFDAVKAILKEARR